MSSSPRVVLVHDWLTGMRGGEKVLEMLCNAYPDADLLTLVHVPGSVSPAIERHRPRASFLTHLPGIHRFYRYCLPLFPAMVEHFDLDQYDLIISTSHFAVKSVVKPGRARHLCYCFTPMRYAWDQFDAYFHENRVGSLASRLLRPILGALAHWDAATAGRVDRYVAISQHVASRILTIIATRLLSTPVETSFYCPDGTQPEDFLLIVSAHALQADRPGDYRLLLISDPFALSATAGTWGLMNHAPERRCRVLAVSTKTFAVCRRASAVLLPGRGFRHRAGEAQSCGGR